VCRFVFATICFAALIAGSAGAEDLPRPPKLGMAVVQNDDGVRVAGVTVGGVADLMGLQEGDTITFYRGGGVEKKAPTLTDMKAFLDGKEGRYLLVVQHRKGGTTEIAGSLSVFKSDPNKVLFIPDKKPPAPKK
jgi:C-terminal processing protease CtpA/Prc